MVLENRRIRELTEAISFPKEQVYHMEKQVLYLRKLIEKKVVGQPLQEMLRFYGIDNCGKKCAL